MELLDIEESSLGGYCTLSLIHSALPIYTVGTISIECPSYSLMPYARLMPIFNLTAFVYSLVAAFGSQHNANALPVAESMYACMHVYL